MCYFRLFILFIQHDAIKKYVFFCKQDMISFLKEYVPNVNKCPLEITVINLLVDLLNSMNLFKIICILVLSMHDAQTIEVSMKIKLNLLHYVS